MKTNILNNRKAALVIAAAFIVSSLPFTSAVAGEKAPTKSVATAEALPGIATKYLGEKDEQIFIRIAVNQPAAQRSYLRIYDFNGELLYEEMVTEKNHAKVIKVAPSEISSLNIVYSTGVREAKKTVLINTFQVARKYDITEVTNF